MKTFEQMNQTQINFLWPHYQIEEDRRMKYAMREWETEQKFKKFQVVTDIPDPKIGVWVWNSGRDCDGVEYGHTSFIEAKTYADYVAALDEAYSWADGPMYYSIIPEYEVDEANSQSYSNDTFAAAAGY